MNFKICSKYFCGFLILIQFFLIHITVLYAFEDEYRLKAAYIGNFTLFIDWPQEALTQDDSFHIAVIHDTGIGNALKELADNLPLKQKKVVVTCFNEAQALQVFDPESLSRLPHFSIIYISSQAKNLIERIVLATQHSSVLIITESPGAILQGSHINLYKTDDQYLRFEIHEQNFSRSHLRISSRLLKLGRTL